MRTLFVYVVIIVLLYTYIPNFYYRNLSKYTLKKLSSRDKVIALTFDDGPDERYTPSLLEFLKKQNIKCTFFVVAEKALNNKPLIKRMSEDGHSIGIHSLSHRCQWLCLPSRTKADFKASLEYMNKLGLKVKFFRPPWGAFNIVTLHYARKNGLKVILWSTNAKDWNRKTTTEDIEKRLLSKICPGSIIVLHDSSKNYDMPLRTLEALKNVIPKLRKEGYKFITLSEFEKLNADSDIKEAL